MTAPGTGTVIVVAGRPVTVVNIASSSNASPVAVGQVRPSFVGLADVDTTGAPVDQQLALRRGTDGVWRPEPVDAIGDVEDLVNAAVEDALDTELGPALDAALPQRLGYRHDWSAPSLLVQVPHGLPYAPAGVLIRDSLGAIVDPGDVTHPLPGITEITFGVPVGPAVAYLS